MKSIYINVLILIFVTSFGFCPGCMYDGKAYQTGDVVMIQKCLAQMTCLGDNNFGELKQLG